jgi:hypothetical protein
MKFKKLMNKTTHDSMVVNEASVSRIGYQLWENAGRPTGRDLEFWLAAEAQVRTVSKPQATVAMAQTLAEAKPSKAPRATRGGIKKTWPKPYPSLPKF